MSHDEDVIMFGRINSIMSTVIGKNELPINWFFCFGTMEEYICDKTFSLNYDIDIGVIKEECDTDRLLNCWDGFGFKVEKVVLDDTDKTPLNIHVVPVDNVPENAPSLDIFLWVKRGNIFYHTYDVNKTGKSILPEYTFKGIETKWVRPAKEDIERVRRSGPEMEQYLGEDGTWKYDLWEDHGQHRMRIPFAYGSLLDCWDPGWRFRDARRGQSKTSWEKTVKSCKDL